MQQAFISLDYDVFVSRSGSRVHILVNRHGKFVTEAYQDRTKLAMRLVFSKELPWEIGPGLILTRERQGAFVLDLQHKAVKSRLWHADLGTLLLEATGQLGIRIDDANALFVSARYGARPARLTEKG